jgi:hypothetical protein
MDGVDEDEDEAADEGMEEADANEVDLTKGKKTKKKKVVGYTPEELAAAAHRCHAGEKLQAVLEANGYKISYGALQRYAISTFNEAILLTPPTLQCHEEASRQEAPRRCRWHRGGAGETQLRGLSRGSGRTLPGPGLEGHGQS